MRGIITAREVIRHGHVIVRHFGPTCYLRCVVAVLLRQPTTFLDVVFKDGLHERG